MHIRFKIFSHGAETLSMEFESELNEATLLRLPLPFMVEAALSGNRKILLRCPNIQTLPGCETAGSRIWYSSKTCHQMLFTWEVVEVDGGYLVAINPDHANSMVLEAIDSNIIQELQGYTPAQGIIYLDKAQPVDLFLLDKEANECSVVIETVTSCEVKISASIAYRLRQLIALANSGKRAVLLYSVMHMGVTHVCPTYDLDSQYAKIFQQALNTGVEIYAYKANVTLKEVTLQQQIPVLVSSQLNSTHP